MTARLRRAAWPLGLSLSAHALLGAWFLAQPAKPALPTTRHAAVSFRLMTAAASATPAAAVAAAKPESPRRPLPKPVPKAPPQVPKPPRTGPDEAAQAVVAAATVATAPAPAAVAGVAFAPPRLGLPFGSVPGKTWTPRAAVSTAMPPTGAVPMAQASTSLLRQRSLDGLAHQVAEWTAPEQLDSARCSVSTDDEARSECDPAGLAETLAQRLQSLREAWAAYRRLAPEAPASLHIAYADGRFSLGTPTN